MKLEKLLEFEVLQNDDIEISGTCIGDILLSPTSGGRFQGEKMNGKLVPVGMGVTATRDRHNDIRSTVLFRTDDGQDILMDMNAILNIGEETEEKLMQGEHADPEDYYYKGWCTFHTGSEDYKWLERTCCVCDFVIEDWTKVRTIVYMLL